MDINTIRQCHTVHVEDGSGVIVKSYTDEYWYVLTDYHIVKNVTKDKVTCCFSSQSPLKDNRIVILDDLRDEELDVAIFKISPLCLGEFNYLPICGSSKEFPYRHIGFPKQRQNGAAICDSVVLDITHIDGLVKGHLMEYGYVQPPKKEEIEGMSGGGIYDGLLRLVGLHKQSSNDDENELLGKAAYIPIADFKKVLSSHEGWCPIQEFDLTTFETFTSEVFAFNDDACVRNAAASILMKLDEYEEQIERLSPMDVITTLKNRHYLSEEMVIEEQSRDFWIAFSEFVIGIMVLLDFKIDQENLITAIYDKFHFVYSKEPFDLFDARDKLDMSLLVGVRKDAKLVVGGLLPSGTLRWCVLNSTIPTITCAEQYNEKDIKRSDRRLLQRITIANSCIFQKAVEKSVDDEDATFEHFKELLKSKLQ